MSATDNALLIAAAAAPLMGPNAQLAMVMANIAATTIAQARANGQADITDDQLAALFARDDLAKAADAAAQAAAIARKAQA